MVKMRKLCYDRKKHCGEAKQMIQGNVYTIGAASTGASQLRMFHSLVEPFSRPYEEHRHTAFELSLICTGVGTYQVGKQTYPFQSGDVFLFSTNEPHCIVEVAGEEKLDIMNLQFEPRFLWSAETLLFQVQYPDIFFHRNEKFSHRLSVQPESAREIADKLRLVEREFAGEKADYRLMVKLQILELLVLIRREYANCFRTPSGKVNTAYLAQMEQALDYIDRNLVEDLQLEQVAREAAMSPAYFSTLFKKLNGITLWEYIRSKRIELATEKLRCGNQTIAQIALECGYNSISNFNRSFKAIIGLSPGDYRKARWKK